MAKRPTDLPISPVAADSFPTPGGQSIGQRSLGVESSTSGYSVSTVNSGCRLLKGGAERDVIIEERLKQLDHVTEEDKQCGIGRCRPQCIQWCASIKLFVFFMCLLITMSGTLSTGYLNSVITTIEKRFEIGSSISGLIAASYEFGSLVAVIFISYFGGRRYIPRWIGTGVILMGFGALLFALPHIIAKKYTVHHGIINETDENICHTVSKGEPDDKCLDKNAGNWVYVLILITAQILIGTGGTPIFTLGTTYIDNHVPKDKAPAYLAFTYATGALGPVVGYALGALFLQFYVDVFSYEVAHLSPAHPRWIGAWWGGFIICGFALFALSIPFMAFPRVLINEKRKVLESKARQDLINPGDADSDTRSERYGKDVKDIPCAILNLLKNKIYLITSFGICCEISIVSGFVVFLPKYIETQFGTSKSEASLFTGGIAIPGAVFGVLLGGFLLKRFQLGPKGAIQLTILLDGLALLGCIFFFFLGCDNLKLAGATFPYFNSSGYQLIDAEFEANLTSSCNMYCDCSNDDLEPICGINGLTYFSPCHAGCTQFNINDVVDPSEKSLNFTACSCILGNGMNSEVIMSPMATSGPCKSTCHTLLPFLILLVFMTFCVAGTQMPILMITLRSVREEERCFALGMQFVILRLFAYIPAPMVYGSTIDTACLLWRSKCGGQGSCLIYDIVQFRHRYVGFSAGLKIVGATLFGIVWILMRRRSRREISKTMAVGEMMNSVTSINKLDFGYSINQQTTVSRKSEDLSDLDEESPGEKHPDDTVFDLDQGTPMIKHPSHSDSDLSSEESETDLESEMKLKLELNDKETNPNHQKTLTKHSNDPDFQEVSESGVEIQEDNQTVSLNCQGMRDESNF